MAAPLRAAVVGGSGFGKYHAQWYAVEGADVVAYACTLDESVEASEGPMLDLTHQEPRGYTDLDLLLRSERPEVVSVCTPPDRHEEPVKAALASGAHVLCEKPLIYDRHTSPETMLARADAVVGAAQDAGKVLAVNLQYAAVVEPYLRLYEREWGKLEAVNSYEFDMESKGNRHGPCRFETSWIELGPHALTPLLALLPNASLDLGSIRTGMNEAEVVAEMIFVQPDGRRVSARMRTAACAKDATPARRFGFNGFLIDILGRRGEAGLFEACYRPVEGDGEEAVGEDPMRLCVRRFLAAARGQGTALVTGEEGRRNLEVLLAILEQLPRRD